MSLLNLVTRKKRKTVITAITTLSSLLLSVSIIKAESITPFFTEETLAYGESANRSITIQNDYDYDIYLTPHLYKYYPQSEYITELKEHEELVIIDTDYILIPANSKKEIRFTVKAPQSLETGTYYNLIVFQHSEQSSTQGNSVGTSGALSHVVQVNIVEQPNTEKITDKYDIHLEVLDRGIPFVKPAKLKFTFFNNSQYTLIPQGEIQVVKRSGNKEPEYLKINMDRQRVFPEESFEQEFEVKNWYIEDIIFGKTAYLQVKNGLDDNVRTEEVKIGGFLNEFLFIIISITVIILLALSIKEDTKPKQEYAE
jgi:hypothetical protein